MVDVVRYAEKFESPDGSLTYTFPTVDMGYDAAQPFRQTLAPAVGADFAHDFAGADAWTKDVAIENVRFIIWGSSGADADSAFDTMASTLRRIGLGKLYLKDQAGNRRWAWAKLAARPSYSTDANAYANIAVTLQFVRVSNWYGPSATTGSQAVTTPTQSFTINNPGNATVRDAVFRLRANAARGFDAPVIRNTTTGEAIAIARVADWATSEIRIDCGAMSVQLSDDDGANYTDIYNAVALGAAQTGFLSLAPGNNTIVAVAGQWWPLLALTSLVTPNYSFEWSFYAAYE